MEFGKSIKAIVFDFDGTIFHLNVEWGKLKLDLGLDDSRQNLGDVIERYNRINHPDLQKVTNAELAAIGDRRLNVDIVNTLEALAKKYKLAIFTRNSRVAVEKVLNGTNLGGQIKIVGREDVSQLKPHPEGLRQIADYLKTEASELLIVGDTYHDIESAHAIGSKCAIVANPQLAYRPKGADYYLENLQELVQ